MYSYKLLSEKGINTFNVEMETLLSDGWEPWKRLNVTKVSGDFSDKVLQYTQYFRKIKES